MRLRITDKTTIKPDVSSISHTSPEENFDNVVRLTASALLYTVVITAARIFKPTLFTYRHNENNTKHEIIAPGTW